MSCIESMRYIQGVNPLTNHAHNTDQMVFVCSGEVDLRTEDGLYHIDSPSVVFISRLGVHQLSNMRGNYCRYVINIDPVQAYSRMADGDRLLSPFWNRPTDSSCILQVGDIQDTLQSLFALLLEEVDRGDFPAGQAALLQSILQYLYRYKPALFRYRRHPVAGTVRMIQQRFHQNPGDEITVAALAEECHLSVSYLIHSFKEETGYSIGQYRLLCRLAAARHMLLTTQLSVNDISNRCGFADMSNFCRYFRRAEGCSPLSFRKEHSSAAESYGTVAESAD